LAFGQASHRSGHDAHPPGHTHNDELAIERFDGEGGAMHAVDPDHGHAFDPQDMMNMGGLRKTMPVPFITFLIGGLSLAGLPLITAGFWSKDEILAEAFYGGFTRNYLGAHAIVFIALVLAATLTAFYTMR